MKNLKEAIDLKQEDLEKIPLSVLQAKPIEALAEGKGNRSVTSKLHNDPAYHCFDFGKPITKMI